MRVLLINPPYPISETPSPPLGLAYLAGALLAAGNQVEVLDLVVNPGDRQELARVMERFEPQVVGITSVTMTFPAAAGLVRRVRELDPRAFTVMGGPHVTFRAREEMEALPELDAVALGEGEATLVELARVLELGKPPGEVAGLVLRGPAGPAPTARRKPVADLGSLAKPARSLLPLGRYRALGLPVSMTSSRGCPHGCIFCVGRKMVGARVRYFPLQRVLEEMAELAGLGFSQINLADELFTSDRERSRAFCRALLATGTRVKWSAFARVDTVDRETLGLMKQAGCGSLGFGVESGDQAIVDRSRKGIRLEQVEEAVAACAETGIVPMLSFILGLPGEDESSIQKSLAFAEKLKEAGAVYGFHILAPFPGSRVEQRAAEYGIRILSRDWGQYHANRAVSETAGADKERLDGIVKHWEDRFNEWLGQVQREGEAGQARPEDLAVLHGIERAAGIYELMMSRALEELGQWESDALDGATLLPELAQRVAGRTSLGLAALSRSLGQAFAAGDLEFTRQGRRVGFAFRDFL